MKISLIFISPVALAATLFHRLRHSSIDTEPLSPNTESNGILERLAMAANRPASEIKKAILEIRQANEIADTAALGRFQQSNLGTASAQEIFVADVGVALGVSLGGEKNKRRATQQDAPELCVKWCVNIREQSCERLRGTHLSGKRCNKERIQSGCADSCKK